MGKYKNKTEEEYQREYYQKNKDKKHQKYVTSNYYEKYYQENQDYKKLYQRYYYQMLQHAKKEYYHEYVIKNMSYIRSFQCYTNKNKVEIRKDGFKISIKDF